jgi:tetratricopeptide (TPR) repeat protein
MYKKRIDVWNLRKNLKKVEKAALVRRVRQTRGAEGLFFRGRPIQHRLERYCRENPTPPEGLENTFRGKMQRRSAYPVRVSGESESAEHRLLSFCPSPFQPSQPVALYGDIRSAEVILWNTEVYLNFYLATGPGTRYFRKDTVMAARKGLPAQSSVLVKNEGAWKDVVNPGHIFQHLLNATNALDYGFIGLAFKSIDKATKLIEVTLQQQEPSLLAYLFPILTDLMESSSNLGQKTLQFILSMAATVLGDRHPMSVVVKGFCTLSSPVDKCYVWRGVVDALSKSFAALEDSQLLHKTRSGYLYGLLRLGSIDEAHDYLDVIYYQDGKIEETNPRYAGYKSSFLILLGKYMEAESQLMRVMDVVQEVELEVLADATSAKSSITSVGDVFDCLYYLALALARLERIEEAKAIWWRAFEFASAAWGLDHIHTQLAGSILDDLLTEHGFVEESAALRAQHSWLLRRQKLPREYL